MWFPHPGTSFAPWWFQPASTVLLERTQTRPFPPSLVRILLQAPARPPTSSAAPVASACLSPGGVTATGTVRTAAMRRSAVSGHALGWDFRGGAGGGGLQGPAVGGACDEGVATGGRGLRSRRKRVQRKRWIPRKPGEEAEPVARWGRSSGGVWPSGGGAAGEGVEPHKLAGGS